jgi:hypothetical protein
VLAITLNNIMLGFSLNVKGHGKVSLFGFVYTNILWLANIYRGWE